MITQFDRPEAYVAAAAAIADDPGQAELGIPILCRPGSPLDALVSRWSPELGQMASRPRADNAGRNVIVVGDDPVAVGAAAMLAALTGGDVQKVPTVRRLPRLMRAGSGRRRGSAVVVGLGKALDLSKADPTAFLDLGAPRGLLGFLTARDQESLTWLVAKSLLSSQVPGTGQILLLPERAAKGVADVDMAWTQVEALCGKAAEHALDNLLQDGRPRALIAVEAHGRTDHLGIGNGIICGDRLAHLGYSSGPEGAGRVPQCAFGHGCFKTGTRVAISQLPAWALFLHSCTSLHIEADMYEESFLLAFAAVEGLARHVIGAIRPMHDIGHAVEMISALAAAGAPAGEAVRLLNVSYAQHRGEPAPYLLLGDPDLPLAEPGPGLPAWRHVSLGADAAALPLDGKSTAMLATLPRVAGVGDDVPDSVGTLTVRHPDETEILAWRYGGLLPEAALPIRDVEDHVAAGVGARWDHVDHGIAMADMLGLLPSGLRARVNELREHAAAVGMAEYESRFFPGRIRKLEDGVTALDEKIRDCDRALMNALLGTEGPYFDAEKHLEGDYLAIDTVYGEQVCWCGRDAVITRLRPLLGIREVRRRYNCMQCGDYAQIALDGLDLLWQADEYVPAEGDLDCTFHLSNPRPHLVTGLLALNISPWYGGEVTFRPRTALIELPAEATASVGVQAHFAGLKPHRYTVEAILVSHLRINMYSKFVQLVPAGQ